MTPLAAIKGGHFGQALAYRASRIALSEAKTDRLANKPYYVKCRIVCFQTLSFFQGANLHLSRIPALDLAALRRRDSAISHYLTRATRDAVGVCDCAANRVCDCQRKPLNPFAFANI
jgi:hypothetical protein